MPVRAVRVGRSARHRRDGRPASRMIRPVSCRRCSGSIPVRRGAAQRTSVPSVASVIRRVISPARAGRVAQERRPARSWIVRRRRSRVDRRVWMRPVAPRTTRAARSASLATAGLPVRRMHPVRRRPVRSSAPVRAREPVRVPRRVWADTHAPVMRRADCRSPAPAWPLVIARPRAI